MISTFTGRKVNPFQMEDKDIHIRDIAHSLALTNRFAGHTFQPISVAQHSVCVAMLVADSPHFCQGLLHDASEAYLGDVTRWLKATPEMKAYCTLEDEVQRRIYRRFGCSEVMHPTVEDADNLMVRIEAVHGYERYPIDHPNFPIPTSEELKHVESVMLRYHIHESWKPWHWRKAERAFLELFFSIHPNELLVE